MTCTCTDEFRISGGIDKEVNRRSDTDETETQRL